MQIDAATMRMLREQMASTALPRSTTSVLAEPRARERAHSGFAHLVIAGRDGLELWRGPRCHPGVMSCIGPRGDLWRAGALRSDGQPLGPV